MLNRTPVSLDVSFLLMTYQTSSDYVRNVSGWTSHAAEQFDMVMYRNARVVVARM